MGILYTHPVNTLNMTAQSNEWRRIIAHADMDAFYASVEQLDNPKLRGRPVLVGPRSGRGVVLTASYEARPFKVGSAMPMVKALKRCPHAVVVPPRFERYTELSERVMSVFKDFSPKVEPLSLDEAFLDMTGASHIFGPPLEMAEKLRLAVFDATGGLTVSVGVAQTKYVAKVASGYAKPSGLTIVHPSDAAAWLAPQSIARLWGAGLKTQARMLAFGYTMIGDVADADPELLKEQLGGAGLHFYELANARDPRRVESSRRARSMGSDRTLESDVVELEDIQRYLRRSADRLARRLRRKGILAGGVRVRLKTTDFKLLTRQCTLANPTDVADEMFDTACQLLDRFNHKGPFRLVGMAAHGLMKPSEPKQLDLLAHDPAKRNLEVVMDQVVERFGPDGLRRARDVASTLVSESTPNLDFVSE